MSKPQLVVPFGGTSFSAFFHRMLEQRGIVKRMRKPTRKVGYVKGAFSRIVLRNQVRQQLSYRSGTLGLSSDSETIKKRYGSILNRRERKQIARETNLRRPKQRRHGR